MSERLLSAAETARRLCLSRTHFYRIRPGLLALGLQQVAVGGRTRYREASLDRLIKEAAERETPITRQRFDRRCFTT